MSTELLEERQQTTGNSNDEPAHIVKGKGKVTEAYVLGKELEALCGHRFVPKRDPKNRPVCQACKEKAKGNYT